MNKDIGLIIGGFITLMMGLVLLGALGDTTAGATSIETAINDEVFIGSTGNGTVSADTRRIRVYSLINFSNGTAAINNYEGELAATAISKTFFGQACMGVTNISWCPNGSIYINNTVQNVNKRNGTYNFSYTYQDADYVSDSQSRTLMGLLPLFFAIGLLLAGIGLSLVGFKRMGLA